MKNYLTNFIASIKGPQTLMVSIVGGGGKTTTIYQLARTLKTQYSVLMTTTTAMFHPHNHVDQLFFGHLPQKSYPKQVVGLFEDYLSEKDKMIGLSLDKLSQIQADYSFDFILNEADGARRKPIKCYGAHEPAIPASSDLVIVVIGADALGQPLSDKIALRLEDFTRVTGLKMGETITETTLLRLLCAEEGFLKGIPGHAKALVIVNKSQSYPVPFDTKNFAEKILEASPLYQGVIFAEMADFNLVQVFEKSSN